jgi:hypothetical protein
MSCTAALSLSASICEHRLRRLDPGLVDRGLVHARGVVVADQLLGAAGRPVLLRRDLDQDVLDVLLVGLARGPAAAPAVHVGGDRVLLAPAAVRVVEEIRARVGLGVHVAGAMPWAANAGVAQQASVAASAKMIVGGYGA